MLMKVPKIKDFYISFLCIDTTVSTCVEPGKQMRYCLDCYEEEYAELPATGEHEWDDWYTVKAATIKKTGIKERECYICGETQTKTISKLKPFIKLSKKTVKLQTSKTYSLKIRYAKGDSIKKCTSSNKKVATVTKKGKIKAKKKGTATITVVLKSGKRAKCKVTVSAKKKKAGSNNSSSNGTVYWTPNGAVYHSTKNCPTLTAPAPFTAVRCQAVQKQGHVRSVTDKNLLKVLDAYIFNQYRMFSPKPEPPYHNIQYHQCG